MRQCTICGEGIPPKTKEHVIAIRSFKYYANYNRDIAHPTKRLKHVWCPKCTTWYNEALNKRMKDIEQERLNQTLDEIQGH